MPQLCCFPRTFINALFKILVLKKMHGQHFQINDFDQLISQIKNHLDMDIYLHQQKLLAIYWFALQHELNSEKTFLNFSSTKLYDIIDN